MIFEVAGCSCAGKSSLCDALVRSTSTTGDPVVCAPIYRRYASIKLLPMLFQSIKQHSIFIKFAFKQIDLRVDEAILRLRFKWNVLRTLACFEIARTFPHRYVVLDEGPINLIQTIFCGGVEKIELPDLQEFIRLVPLPPIVFILKVDTEVLKSRLLDRELRNSSELPLPNRSKEQNRLFVERAAELFASRDFFELLSTKIEVRLIENSPAMIDLVRSEMAKMAQERIVGLADA